MVRRTRTQLEEMILRAQTFVAEGQQRIAAQRARVAALDRRGGRGHESKQFLETMEVTQALQIAHLDLLRRELNEMDWVARPALTTLIMWTGSAGGGSVENVCRHSVMDACYRAERYQRLLAFSARADQE
jgi:hypothetical protein